MVLDSFPFHSLRRLLIIWKKILEFYSFRNMFVEEQFFKTEKGTFWFYLTWPKLTYLYIYLNVLEV